MSITTVLNKTFFKIAFLLAILASIAFLFAGCGLGKLSGGPNKDDVVSGNGSLAVQKGDYLYFVNGYRDTSAIGDTNHHGSVDQSAIYRVKLTQGRVTEADKKYDEDDNEIFDETKSIKDVDILVPKVAGFEQSKLFIFGDYLYYATPNNLRDGTGKIKSDYLHIYRVRLDRSGSNDLIYSSEHETTKVSWTMHQVDEAVYMTILDEDHLTVVAINGKDYKSTKVSDDVTSASLPSYSRSDEMIKDIDKSIYFTTKVEDDDSTTLLKKYDLEEGKVAEDAVRDGVGEKYEIKGTKGNKLYYTKTISGQPGFTSKVYAMSTSNAETLVSAQSVGDSADIQAYALTDSTQETSIIYTDGSSSFFKLASQATAVKFLSSNIVKNIVKIQGDYVYYLNESNLYKVNYTLANQTGEKVINNSDTPKGDIVNNFAVSGDKVFYFVKYTENYYMHFMDLSQTVSVSDNTPYSHFIGKLLPADYVSETTTE